MVKNYLQKLFPDHLKNLFTENYYIISFKEVIEECLFTTGWQEFCKERGVFQLPIKEFCDNLSIELYSLIAEYSLKGPFLELGAGNGWLTRYLNKCGHRFIAIDSGMLYLRTAKKWQLPYYPVLLMDWEEAINTFRPQLVVISWMPMGEDWSKLLRKTPSLKIYILIGEELGGRCGDWDTFLLPLSENWQRRELTRSSSFSLSAADFGFSFLVKYSKTVAWIKI